MGIMFFKSIGNIQMSHCILTTLAKLKAETVAFSEVLDVGPTDSIECGGIKRNLLWKLYAALFRSASRAKSIGRQSNQSVPIDYDSDLKEFGFKPMIQNKNFLRHWVSQRSKSIERFQGTASSSDLTVQRKFTLWPGIRHSLKNGLMMSRRPVFTVSYRSTTLLQRNIWLIQLILFATVLNLAVAPQLLAVDILYVSLSNNSIVTFDTTGSKSSNIELSKTIFADSNNYSYLKPGGLVFDRLGNLFVSSDNSYILEFDKAGAFQSSFYGSPFLPNKPSGIAVDSSGNLYQSLNPQNAILKFNASDNFQTRRYLADGASVVNPIGLAVDSSDNIFVAHNGYNIISKLGSNGTNLGIINTNLNNPQGLAFDGHENLYVSNSGDNTISKFNALGAYLGSLGGNSSLNSPFGLAFDSLGNLYAANSGDGTISKFDSAGSFICNWNIGGGGVYPTYMTVRSYVVPEPCTFILVVFNSVLLYIVALCRE